jgi:hypothetical protein
LLLRFLSSLVFLLPLLLPAAPAAFGPGPFSLQYDIDEAGDRIGYSTQGTFSAAIRCHSGWNAYSGLTLPPLSLRDPVYLMASSSSTPAPKSVVYHVVPSEGKVRVSEFLHGTRATDTVFACGAFSLDAGPATVVEPTWEARHEAPVSAGCGTTLQPEAWFNAQLDENPKDAQTSLRATDRGACIVLGYATMIPGGSCPTPQGVCVPFSGNLGGYVKSTELTGVKVWAEGVACSDFIIGGYCFGGEPAAAESKFAACECPVNSRGFAAFNNLTGFTSAGSWYYRAERWV